MKAVKRRKKINRQKLKAKFNLSAAWFYLIKKFKNNFVAYYLILTYSSPSKLKPYYHTFIYTLIRKIAELIINFKGFRIKRIQIARGISLLLIIAITFVQVVRAGAYEAHVINVTATIVNDIPLIEPDGGEFCNLTGAEITISSTLTIDYTIIYTTDGSDPDCPNTGSIYTAPFTIFQSATIKARTCHGDKQSAVMSKNFTVTAEICPIKNCNAETINYWAVNHGCEQNPAVSEQAVLINNLSLNNFQGAFYTITGAEICTALDLTSCPAEGTLTSELCRARGQTLAVMSNIVTGRLDLNAVIAGAFDNSVNFTNFGLTASSTIKQALEVIEIIISNPGHTVTDLANVKFIAQRINKFYNSENPYAPEPTCIYYEPGNVVLNEFIPNPSCSAQPVDVALVMDRSGSMGDTSKCEWWKFTCINSPSCSLGYEWVFHTDYDETQAWCTAKNQPAPHESVWTEYNPVKITAAKLAANDFIDLLGSEDQSSLVSYATTYTLDKQLSNNHAATKTAINSLITNGATDIGDAIDLANIELTNVRANPLAVQAQILLNDGMANKPFGPGYGEYAPDVAYAKAKADEAAGLGIKIFTIGLGSDVNASMLEYIASTTGAKFYSDPTGDDLKAIYTQISEELCNAENDQNLFGLAGEWAELYNKGISDIDVADWLITNTSATSTIKISDANTLATSTIIGAAGSGQEWLVALFNQARLNNNGDTIFLYDNLGHLLDFYSYTDSIDNDPEADPNTTPGESNSLDANKAGIEGKSFARIPDGTTNWVDPIPTPGRPNRLEAVSEVAAGIPEIIVTPQEASIEEAINNPEENNSLIEPVTTEEITEEIVEPVLSTEEIPAEKVSDKDVTAEEIAGGEVDDEDVVLPEEVQVDLPPVEAIPESTPVEEEPVIVEVPKEQSTEPTQSIGTELTSNIAETTL
jgi:hypothetical protein